MSPIRIKTRITSDTLKLPELRALIGLDVEIVVSTQEAVKWKDVRKKLKGSVLADDDPFGPASPTGDWEAAA
ncbi:MAG: hypothetical protein IT462_01650 [Planctomycetes bacterium]|nr:hypothetical protein [Planctomycetota bacterium]